MNHLSPSHRQLKERLATGGDVTEAELNHLRAELDTLDRSEREELRQAVDAYADKRREALAADVETASALGTLRKTLEEQAGPVMEQVRTTATELGKQARDTAVRTYEHGRALTEREFTYMMNPHNSTGSKILRGIGVFSLLYVTYRLARWAAGKPGDSFLGKVLKFTGIAALAGYGINYFGKKLTKTDAEEVATNIPAPLAPASARQAARAPVATRKRTPRPRPVPKPKPAPKARPKSKAKPVPVVEEETPDVPEAAPVISFDDAPQNANLVGKGAIAFTVSGKAHTIEFQSGKIVLDGGSIFGLSSLGTSIGDVPLDIKDARMKGKTFFLKAGAWGKEDTAEMTQNEWSLILQDMLKGKSVQRETDSGGTVEIAPKKY